MYPLPDYVKLRKRLYRMIPIVKIAIAWGKLAGLQGGAKRATKVILDHIRSKKNHDGCVV